MNSAKKNSQSIDAAGFKTFSKTVLKSREEGRWKVVEEAETVL